MKKVIFTTGGTGGHIYPALAVADELKNREVDCMFVGTIHRMERDLIPRAGYKFIGLDIIPFNSIRGIVKLLKATVEAFKILRKEKPDAVFGFGNYISVPILTAAFLTRTKIYLQEQNAEFGMANSLFYRWSKKTFLAFEKTYDDLPQKYTDKLKVTGNPLRKEFSYLDVKHERDKLKIKENEKMLLITGGSQGSKNLNDAVLKHWDTLFKESNIRIYWSTGENNFEEVNNKISKMKPNDVIRPYFSNMPSVMTASDLVICRAGALTISEVIELEKPSIFVPLNAGGQKANADMLKEKNAALGISTNSETSSTATASNDETKNTLKLLLDTIKQNSQNSSEELNLSSFKNIMKMMNNQSNNNELNTYVSNLSSSTSSKFSYA